MKVMDKYGFSCTLQESKLNDFEGLYLGTEFIKNFLTKDMIEKLIPKLQRFIETGVIE